MNVIEEKFVKKLKEILDNEEINEETKDYLEKLIMFYEGGNHSILFDLEGFSNLLEVLNLPASIQSRLICNMLMNNLLNYEEKTYQLEDKEEVKKCLEVIDNPTTDSIHYVMEYLKNKNINKQVLFGILQLLEEKLPNLLEVDTDKMPFLADMLIALKEGNWKEYSSNLMSIINDYLNLFSHAIKNTKKRKHADNNDELALWDGLISFNFNFIDSKPFSVSSLYGKDYNMQDLTALKLRKIAETNEDKLVSAIIVDEEQKRLKLQEDYREIKSIYDKPSFDGINRVIELLNNEGLTDMEGIKAVRLVFMNRLIVNKSKEKMKEQKKEKAKEKKTVIIPKKTNEPIKLGYTIKEIKQMENYLEEFYNRIINSDEKETITVKEFLEYIRKSLIVRPFDYQMSIEFSTLYDHLNLTDEETYKYLVEKANALISNLEFNLYPVMEDISFYKETEEEVKDDVYDLLECKSELENLYEVLYDRLSKDTKFQYERSLVKNSK